MGEVVQVGVFDRFFKKKIQDSQLVFTAKRISEHLRGSLDSVVVYGSYVTGEFVPGSSDINLLIVIRTEADMDLLRLSQMCKEIAKRPISVPLILSKDYILESLDTFPLEYLNISRNCKVLYGSNFIMELPINKKNLRYQCEKEIKSKLLLLRQIYFTHSGNRKILQNTLISSWRAIGSMLKGLYYLIFSEYPYDTSKMLNELEKGLNTELKAILVVYRLKTERSFRIQEDIDRFYNEYVKEISFLSEKLDKMEVLYE